MSHGLGVTRFVNGNAPDLVVVLFALLTQFGDLWFYFLALSVAYYFAERLPRLEGVVDRRRVAYLVALALGATALSMALKVGFAHPRPPGAGVAEGTDLIPAVLRPIYEGMATGEGYSFPSGHATGAAVVWGGAATVLSLGARRTRYAAVGLVVVLIALSRVVLGVHFLLDVVAGVVVGLLYLVVVDRITARGARPDMAFSLAVLVAAVGVLQTGLESESVAILGATLGARIAWEVVGERVVSLPVTRRAAVLNLTVGLPVFGGLFGVTYALEPAPPLAFVGAAAALAGVLATPLLGAYLTGRDGAVQTGG